MNDFHSSAPETLGELSPELERRLQQVVTAIDDKLKVEAMAQLVEQLELADQVKGPMQIAVRDLWAAFRGHESMLGLLQGEFRDLMIDMALAKRALVSLGQIGVFQRQRIEKELIRELFPPRLVRRGTGVVVAEPRDSEARIDCEDRLSLCKAACCRIFNVHLTAAEIEGDKYDWNPRVPYSLHKNRLGCLHLRSGDWSCSIYDCRPSVCLGYSCREDRRIWADFEKRVVNPDLKQQLDKLDGRHEGTMPRKDESSSILLPEKNSVVNPPDFSKFNKMIAPEPNKKFVPSRTAVGD